MNEDIQECHCHDDAPELCLSCDRQSRDELIAENMRLRNQLIEDEKVIARLLLKCGETTTTKTHPAIVAIDAVLGRISA